MKAAGLATAFGGDIAVMDVYAAQQMFGRGRTFDRIDLALAEGVTRVDAEREIEALLGPAFDVQPPATRGEQAESLVAGYTMMVNVSSAFALFIGMFIIYNSFAIAVTQRRSEIGILRALGATRSQITRLFLGESVVLGLLGASVGVGLGALLARAIASSISALIGNLYGVAEQASDVATTPLVLGLSLAIGVAASLMGAVIPARQAAQIDPVHALKKGSIQILSVARGLATRRRRAGARARIGPVSGDRGGPAGLLSRLRDGDRRRGPGGAGARAGIGEGAPTTLETGLADRRSASGRQPDSVAPTHVSMRGRAHAVAGTHHGVLGYGTRQSRVDRVLDGHDAQPRSVRDALSETRQPHDEIPRGDGE